MKLHTAIAVSTLALASLPLLAQSVPASQPGNPAMQQSPAAATQAPPTEMRPVKAELESKLDSKTAKAGDSVVVKTKDTVKTADGTEIPKGSKLMGHVIAVKASEAGANSQVALQFDHAELKGGQSLPVHLQIESIAPAGAMMNASAAAATGNPPMNAAPATGASAAGMTGANRAASAPQSAGAAPAADPAANSGPPAPGTVVAKNGNISIATTAVPGVLLANNAPGQQDPRMAQASSILLGARRDIQLDGGTEMVVDLSAAAAPAR